MLSQGHRRRSGLRHGLLGLAYAIGPNYNKPWDLFEPEEKVAALEEAHEALEKAQALTGLAPVETAMIDALASRYPSDPRDRGVRSLERRLHRRDAPGVRGQPGRPRSDRHIRRGGDEPDTLALVGSRERRPGRPTPRPSKLAPRWRVRSRATPGPGTTRGCLHLYIHLMEMSPWPELALSHGDRLCELVPESGHLQHMATHIDVLCGDYQNVIERNHWAATVDRKFEDYAGSANFYTLYRIHNVHFEAYGAMFIGRKSQALAAADTLRTLLPVETVAFLPDFFEAFWGIRLHVLVRFGMWQEILDEPLPEDAELFSFTTALQYYARTVALANLGRIAEAEAERDLFHSARAKVPESRYMFNNPARASSRSPSTWPRVNWPTSRGASTKASTSCAPPCSPRTISSTTSPGVGCSHRGMPWPRFYWIRVGTRRPSRSTAPISASTIRSRAPSSTLETSGLCTDSTSAWPPVTKPWSGLMCSRCSPRHSRAPRCPSAPPATAGATRPDEGRGRTSRVVSRQSGPGGLGNHLVLERPPGRGGPLEIPSFV